MKEILTIEIRARTTDEVVWIVGNYNVYDGIDFRRFAALKIKKQSDIYGSTKSGATWLNFIKKVDVLNIYTGENLFSINLEPTIQARKWWNYIKIRKKRLRKWKKKN